MLPTRKKCNGRPGWRRANGDGMFSIWQIHQIFGPCPWISSDATPAITPEMGTPVFIAASPVMRNKQSPYLTLRAGFGVELEPELMDVMKKG